MKKLVSVSLVCSLLLSVGCQSSTVVTTDSKQSESSEQHMHLVSQVVDASCGECQFKLEGNGCDLAVRIDGKAYYVDGAKMDEHGDAHGEHGMCNAIRKAKVTGEINEGRFVATSFELLPPDNEPSTQSN
jgi:Family of unknown function (DUF6370)